MTDQARMNVWGGRPTDGLGVERAADSERAFVQNVGINHCRFHILVAEESLDSANIMTLLQEVGGEAMAESVRGDVLVDARHFGCISNRRADGAFVQMVAARDAGAGVRGRPLAGKTYYHIHSRLALGYLRSRA